MRTFKLVIALTLLLLFTIVVVQNTEVVTVRFLAWELTMSRIILLVLTLIVGFAVGYLMAKGTRLKKKVAAPAPTPAADPAPQPAGEQREG